MTRVMAQGTFDLIHPGHIHYLQESRALGDELYVIIARDSRLDTEPVMPEDARRLVVEALKPVDRALLGSEEDIFVSVEHVQPDIITLGHDQPYAVDALREQLAENSLEGIEVVRIGAYDGPVASSTTLRDGIRERQDETQEH